MFVLGANIPFLTFFLHHPFPLLYTFGRTQLRTKKNLGTTAYELSRFGVVFPLGFLTRAFTEKEGIKERRHG